jgi:Mrp family chromosome partitioning ATPase
MSERAMVEIPENAVRDEPIAFGLTAVQLGLCAAAVLAAAVLNLLPLPELLRWPLVVAGGGAIGIAAVLPIRGEPAYRWLRRYVRHRRGPMVWLAVLETETDEDELSANEGAGEPGVSAGAADGEPDVSTDAVAATPLVVASPSAASRPDKSEIRQAVDNDRTDESTASMLTESSSPELESESGGDSEAAPSPSTAGGPDRPILRLVRDEPPNAGTPGPPVPHLVDSLRIVAVLSFAGGAGRTTLAVEAATYVAAHARYRTLEGDERAVRVLLLDASRSAPAAALRLGLDPEAVSRLRARFDWPDAVTLERRVVATRSGADLLTLPGLPFHGLGPALPFDQVVATALVDALHASPYQLLVVDLGSALEPGHEVLLQQASAILGVVRPTIESLGDVYRIAEFVRATGQGRKLALVENAATEASTVPTLAREVDVPLVARVGRRDAFDLAGHRGVPAWTLDAAIVDEVRPLATAAWPLVGGVPATATRRLGGLVAGIRRALRAGDAR